jgi:hypothetical protein
MALPTQPAPRQMPRNGTERPSAASLTPERLQLRLRVLELAVALTGHDDRSARGTLQIAGQLESWLYRAEERS